MTTVTGRNVNRAVGYESEAAVLGGVGEHLIEEQVTEFVTAAIAAAEVENKRVCLVVPDGTRTCPLPLILQAMRTAWLPLLT